MRVQVGAAVCCVWLQTHCVTPSSEDAGTEKLNGHR